MATGAGGRGDQHLGLLGGEVVGQGFGFSQHGFALNRGFPQPNLPTGVSLDKVPEHGVTGPEAWSVSENPDFRNHRAGVSPLHGLVVSQTGFRW